MTPKQREVYEAVQRLGGVRPAAKELGIARVTAQEHYNKAKAYLETDTSVQNAMQQNGMQDAGILHSGWIKTENASLYFVMPNGDTGPSVQDMVEQSCEYLAERSPHVALPVYPEGHHMLVISPADIHMGKLSEAMETGDAYTQELAEKRTKEGVSGLLTMASGFGLECITINTGNDSLHVDNSKKTTTSGTPQDTDGSIFSMFGAMQRTWIWVIEQCAQVAPVRVVFDPSNHPWVSDWMLNQSLAAWFRNDERVTFDISMSSIRHRKYQVYGCNLIGYTHGDGARDKDLPILMQHECREWWGKTKRGYWIIKHKHHKDNKIVGLTPYQAEKDHPGVTVIRSGDMALDRNVAVEIVRSPSGTDGWHDRNGYVGAIKAVEAFLFHHERGQIARFTYPFY